MNFVFVPDVPEPGLVPETVEPVDQDARVEHPPAQGTWNDEIILVGIFGVVLKIQLFSKMITLMFTAGKR